MRKGASSKRLLRSILIGETPRQIDETGDRGGAEQLRSRQLGRVVKDISREINPRTLRHEAEQQMANRVVGSNAMGWDGGECGHASDLSPP